MFKIGDKVRIRNDLIVGRDYYGLTFTDNHNKYKGKEATVIFIDADVDYLLNIDNQESYWSKAMLELVEVKTNLDYILEHYNGSCATVTNGVSSITLNFKFSTTDKNRIGLVNNKVPERLKEWLLSPYEEPKIKITQFEYDLLTTIYDKSVPFNKGIVTRGLKEKGYFKNVDDYLSVQQILERCEVND